MIDVGRGVGRATFLFDAPAACFGGVDLRLHGRAHVLGVLRRVAERGQFFLLLARALERGRDDRAFLRFGIVGGRAVRGVCAGGTGRTRRAGRAPGRGTRLGRFALAALAREAPVVARARVVGLLLAPGIPAGALARDRNQGDAVDRARRHAEIAAGAERGHHRMHLLRRTDDRIHRAGLHAERAADAELFVDHGEQARVFLAVLDGERDHGLAEQRGEAFDALMAAGRALVVAGAAGGDRLGIRATAVVAALRALRLRQQIFDAIREFSGVGHGDCVGWRAPGGWGSARPESFVKAQLSPISYLALGSGYAHNQGAFSARPQQGATPIRPCPRRCRRRRGIAGTSRQDPREPNS
ncbi:hypothetical protein BGL_1c28530 [Burkholderia plantarii]|uniref:Uncharacterized protein n=1 Tax=Burkholderia plantarii TaxID=41899 RepID=A0A0B6S539_BURPL|nr:hypothetical protein BGL_1c28530 [Burkholderia plantarii]